MTKPKVVDWAESNTAATARIGRWATARLAGETAADIPAELARQSGAALAERFGLDRAGLETVLLVAAPELSVEAAAALTAHPLAQGGRATPALVERVLGADAAAALGPEGVLRRAILVRLADGQGFAHRGLVVDEPVVHFLRGHPALSAELDALVEFAPAADGGGTLPERIAEALARAPGRSGARPPILSLPGTGWLVAGWATAGLARVGLGAAVLRATTLPADTHELVALARVATRDLILTGAGLILLEDGVEPSPAPWRLADRAGVPAVVIGGRCPAGLARPVARIETGSPAELRRALWQAALPGAAPPEAGRPEEKRPGEERPEEERPGEDRLDEVAEAFELDEAAIRRVAATAALTPGADLWAMARDEARGALDGLAERIEPHAHWDDLVLPAPQMGMLRQMADFFAHVDEVHDRWGFRAKSARGLGLAALFSGPSGTGKTMAAEILSRELGPAEGTSLDLYRVDLSAVVSKYIGETEKNLARIFDVAERAGAVLLFDEGDALFGQRTSEVRDGVDRYANTEIAYLLQRLESYSGVAVVTTNLQESIDHAFLRRFRYVVEFPFPDAARRREIWRKVLPPEAPLGEIDWDALARLSIAGGDIRAIALSAAFMAAAAGGPIGMDELRRAARQEYAKRGRPLSVKEMGGAKR